LDGSPNGNQCTEKENRDSKPTSKRGEKLPSIFFWKPEKQENRCSHGGYKQSKPQREAIQRWQATVLKENQIRQEKKNKPTENSAGHWQRRAFQAKEKPGSIETEVCGCFPVGIS
jgi:hypothetical protein